MNYTDESGVEDYTLLTIDPSFSSRIDIWIDAMSRYMDRTTNRTLCTGSETTRKFDGNGQTEMLIDEVCAITEITVDTTSVFATALQYPANQANKHKLSFSEDTFTKDRQNVEVTGKFAMNAVTNDNAVDEVPADIKFICTVLVAGIVNNVNNQNDAVKSEKIGNYSVTYNDPNQRKDFMLAKQMLAGLRRVAV